MTDYVLAIDVETTGLNPQEHRIIQIGGVALRIEGDHFRVVGVLDLIVNPGFDVTVPVEIEQLTGLNRQALNFGMPTDKAFLCLQQFLNIPSRCFDGESRVELVGHNIQFDLRMIGAEAQRLGRVTNVPGRCYCTMNALGGGRMRLDTLCRKLGVPDAAKSHNAFADAVTTAACYRALALPVFVGKSPATFIGPDISQWDIWSAIDSDPETVGMTLRHRGLVRIEGPREDLGKL